MRFSISAMTVAGVWPFTASTKGKPKVLEYCAFKALNARQLLAAYKPTSPRLFVRAWIRA